MPGFELIGREEKINLIQFFQMEAYFLGKDLKISENSFKVPEFEKNFLNIWVQNMH